MRYGCPFAQCGVALYCVGVAVAQLVVIPLECANGEPNSLRHTRLGTQFQHALEAHSATHSSTEAARFPPSASGASGLSSLAGAAARCQQSPKRNSKPLSGGRKSSALVCLPLNADKSRRGASKQTTEARETKCGAFRLGSDVDWRVPCFNFKTMVASASLVARPRAPSKAKTRRKETA